MKLLRVLALIGLVAPVFGQYAGPAILSRGQAPAGMEAPQVSFRPFVEVGGIYDSGLTGVAVADNQGNLANDAAYGVRISGGVSGTHQWKRTSLGLDYSGALRHYTKQTYYDGGDQSLMLGLTHQMTRHTALTLRESAGMFSRSAGVLGLPQAVPFDPQSSNIPTTDFFDNRTIYLSSQADFTYQKSARLSFNAGADATATRRRSSALYGANGLGVRGDVQYRISRSSTVGVDYGFTHYNFLKTFGGADLHTAALTYGKRLTKTVEFSAYGGAARMETQFTREVPLDPAVAAILGQLTGAQVIHRIDYVPTFGARISNRFRNGVAYLTAGRAVTPGNGLFLTSAANSVSGGYAYTGLRRWSFNAGITWNQARAMSNVVGQYGSLSGSLSMSRQLSRALHFVAQFSPRRYASADFSNYNRVVYTATIGLGFSPGDIPLRVW